MVGLIIQGLTADAVLSSAATSFGLRFVGNGGGDGRSCPNVFRETFVALKNRAVAGAATQVALNSIQA